MVNLFDFAVTTIFAREVLEGSIIIGEYRTIILRSGSEILPNGVTQREALRAVIIAALVASLFAIIVCAAVAIPLAILSSDFDPRTSKIIEGISKIVAAVCLLQLSLKFPKWLGVYAKKPKQSSENNNNITGLTLRSIRFNVAWNIWREVAECGIFLLPFFLTGEGVAAIPLSALIGTIVGLLLGVGLYYANNRLKNKLGLAIFSAILLLIMSAGLFTGGCHNLESVWGETKTVWTLQGNFWSINRLPMTVLKPFGYSDSRTVLQMVCFWSWLALGVLMHLCKWRESRNIRKQQEENMDRESFAIEQEERTASRESLEHERSLSSSGDVEDQYDDKIILSVDEECQTAYKSEVRKQPRRDNFGHEQSFGG